MNDRPAEAREFSPAIVAEVRLAMTPGVGPLLRRELLQRFGSAEAILDAAPSALSEARGVGTKIAHRIASANQEIDVEAELAFAAENGVRVVTDGAPEYPRLLAQIHDPPGVLFVRGEMQPADNLAIGIVGTRHASRYGLDQAERLAHGLAKTGFTIVSGLARGIDGAAHRGALAAEGRTIAVLGSGVLNVYPPEHVELAREIVASGSAVIGESPPRMAPMAGMFPQRNRIISGLSLGVIIVEAAERSGALITARHAAEQGREVFAVPGRVDQRQARGCHRLIRDGAKLVESIDDVLEELGPLVEATPREDGAVIRNPAEMQLNEIEQSILQAIDADATSIDAIIARSGAPVHRVLSIVTLLEQRRLIRRVSGNQVARV